MVVLLPYYSTMNSDKFSTAIHEISGLEQSPIIPPIYLNGIARYVTGPLGGEKNNQISEFCNFSQSPKWNAFFPRAYS